MDEVKVISTGKEFSKSVSNLLGVKYVESASLNSRVDSALELTVTILLTKEQEEKLLGKG